VCFHLARCVLTPWEFRPDRSSSQMMPAMGSGTPASLPSLSRREVFDVDVFATRGFTQQTNQPFKYGVFIVNSPHCAKTRSPLFYPTASFSVVNSPPPKRRTGRSPSVRVDAAEIFSNFVAHGVRRSS